LWVLALMAGLRQGELLALKWRDIDLERGSLRVVASLVRILGAESVLAETKSRRSRRQVELAATAVDALRRHKAKVIKSALASDKPYDKDGFVFQRNDGRPESGTRTWTHWRTVLRRAGVPHMPFHSARHSAASLLLGRGVHPKLVSELLGHSTAAITLDVYSHVTPAMHREAARVMDELLGS
jgi:integrase